MKIAYVIGPFKSTRYLIRCINALLRLTAGDNEIIIADNNFEKDEDLENLLAAEDRVKLISDKPQTELNKIKEALSLVDDESLVNIISVDTVAVPIASEIVSSLDADIICVSSALKNRNGYDVKLLNANSFIDSGEADIQNLFFKKKVLSDLTADRLSERVLFELWIDKLLLEGATQAVTGEICFYSDKERIEHSADDAGLYLENKALLLEMAEKALKSNSKLGIFLFDKYLSKVYKVLISTQNELSVKSEIFDIIKKFGELAKTDELAKRLFALYLGMDIDSLSPMDAESYLFYADRMLMFADKPLTKARIDQLVEDRVASIEMTFNTAQNKQLKRIKTLEPQVKRLQRQSKSFRSKFETPNNFIKGIFKLIRRWFKKNKI